jgi:redox-sensing transcriptional repressor
METKIIPDIIVGRMPLYLRALQRMIEEGRRVTSSQEPGERLGISAAQIRRDSSQFGEFGKQGTGYSIDYLAGQPARS